MFSPYGAEHRSLCIFLLPVKYDIQLHHLWLQQCGLYIVQILVVANLFMLCLYLENVYVFLVIGKAPNSTLFEQSLVPLTA